MGYLFFKEVKMLEVENIEVWGFEHAIRGMRNPLNSWSKSDSGFSQFFSRYGETENTVLLGKNDLQLMQKLYKAGTEHRKYLRQIFVSMDIIAPLYWWKEFDTYKIGTVANSCSTMHKIHSKEFELDDFSHEHLPMIAIEMLENLVIFLNSARTMYLKTKDKNYWWQLIQLLPTSYNQKRTITMNYENVFSIIKQRTGHKLDEWNMFIKRLKQLPYVKEIMENDKTE